MTSHNCQGWQSSASPLAATVPCAVVLLYSHKACPPWVPPLRAHLWSISVTEETGCAMLVFYNCLCFQHCQRIQDPKKHFPAEVKRTTPGISAQVRAFREADFTQSEREGKWLLWWASAVLLKMWLRTLTKVTSPVVLMSSRWAKLFSIKWQHMAPKSIPNQ